MYNALKRLDNDDKEEEEEEEEEEQDEQSIRLEIAPRAILLSSLERGVDGPSALSEHLFKEGAAHGDSSF